MTDHLAGRIRDGQTIMALYFVSQGLITLIIIAGIILR